MPRAARKKSRSGIYHVMIKGADSRMIFTDDEDCRHFLKALSRAKEKSGFFLYAYCLMDNHVHMLIKEGEEPLEVIFKRIGSSYVYYFNWKYELHGHLFQDRFRSERVEDYVYFLDVLRYICQNPVKAGICRKPFDYPWLGCSGISDAIVPLDSITELSDLSGKDLRDFVSKACHEDHLEDNGPKRLTDREALDLLYKISGTRITRDIGRWKAGDRDMSIKTALHSRISIRQLSRLTGISKSVIERVAKS